MSEYIELAVHVPKVDADLFIARFGKGNVEILGFLLGEEIVRCKDCRKHNQIHGQDWCRESARYVEPECFCSWGERRQQ